MRRGRKYFIVFLGSSVCEVSAFGVDRPIVSIRFCERGNFVISFVKVRQGICVFARTCFTFFNLIRVSVG